jgi:exonuclease III
VKKTVLVAALLLLAIFSADAQYLFQDEKTPGYAKLVESDIVNDAMLALPASKRENAQYFSMANYRPKEKITKNGLHIDHVFYTPANSKVLSWKLILDSYDGMYGSDHLPIVIDWKISN